MNAADLARLEVAKRAYRATEPTAAEVQRGVRKARLSLRRPGPRRAWFSKTLVALVLAMGGLAYAKPQALGELVSNVLRPSVVPLLRHGGAASAATTPPLTPTLPLQATRAEALEQPRSAEPHALPQPAEQATARASNAAAQPRTDLQPSRALARSPSLTSPSAARPVLEQAAGQNAPHAASFADEAETSARNGQRVASDWGRVGAALAGGDEARALAALNELSESDDQRTRDKADLGRAQLFMANGNRDRACATARSLTNRRAGSRIERQAHVLLKSCSR